MCLKLWLGSDQDFSNVTESGWFLKSTFQKQNSKQSLRIVSLKKVTVQKSNAELGTVISNKIVKYQVPHMRFDQISNHKHDIYLYGKLSAKLLVQAANKNTKILYLQKLDSSLSMASEVIDQKNSKQVT